MGLFRRIADGKIAGAAGTFALDAVSYGDVARRGRAASTVPAELVKKLAASAGITALTGDDETSANRRGAIGALLGYATGLAVGGLYGAAAPALRGLPRPLAAVLVAAVAMTIPDVAYAKAGVSDPSRWSPDDWMADAIPHLAYGMSVVAVYDARSRS